MILQLPLASNYNSTLLSIIIKSFNRSARKYVVLIYISIKYNVTV